MLQISFFREEKQRIVDGLKKRNFKNIELVDEVISIDDKRRKMQIDLESYLSEINKISKEVGFLMKEGKINEANEAKQKTSDIKQQIKNIQVELSEVENSLQNILFLKKTMRLFFKAVKSKL